MNSLTLNTELRVRKAARRGEETKGMLITGYTCKARAMRQQILFEKLSFTQYKNNRGNVAWWGGI